MSDVQRLSLKLYDVLEQVGASEELRQLYQSTAAACEILGTITNETNAGKLIHRYICGSRYEGSVIPEFTSDTDVISCHMDQPVITGLLKCPEGPSFLMARDAWTYPGYVKLQWVYDGRPLTIHNMAKEIENAEEVDSVGRWCIDHFTGHQIHGPADQFVDIKGKHYLDSVPAYHCAEIPDHANEWILRQREHGWPSAQHLEKMSNMGCMMVGVGYWNSQDRELEWRLSFSLQERNLMSSLNNVQHKTYILLKMIKKMIVGHCASLESLTSYHCKTCIFHIVETTPASIWTAGNLINCLLMCIKQLLQWLKDGVCPNYFIPDQNLFDKEGFAESRSLLIKEMERILEKSPQFLYNLPSRQIIGLLQDENVELLKEISMQRTKVHFLDLKQDVIQTIFDCCRSFINKSDDLTAAIDKVQTTINDIPNHTAEQKLANLSYITPWLHLYIAKDLACRAINCNDLATRDSLNNKTCEHFQQAKCTDLVSVRMSRASVMYWYGDYKACQKVLEEIENAFEDQVLTYCPCTKSSTFPTFEQEFADLVAPLSIKDILETHVASDVVFLPKEKDIAPGPLQFEMYRSLGTPSRSRDKVTDYWFNWAVVNAKVYLYFMEYLLYSKTKNDLQKKVAILKLCVEVEQSKANFSMAAGNRPSHEDTALNLLGWVYLQEDLLEDALGCFVESWKIRPHHNAAKIHVLCMYAKQAKEKEDRN